MEFRFSTRADGQVDARLVGDYPLFNDALADAISSLPPRGALGNGPSTFWIDMAHAAAVETARSGSLTPFAHGNAALLRMSGEMVEARYDYDEPDEVGERIALSEFLSLLEQWRLNVLHEARSATKPLPDTYRRNAPRAVNQHRW